MRTETIKRQFLFLGIFLSGASGLIYEVVWHRYLAILLGAQARATAVTLGIFLGGISFGYLCFGRWSRNRQRELYRVYALVEIGLFVWGVLFPYLFRLAQPAASSLYRVLGVNSLAIDILLSILLIGFPTFLMGGTLPLLTQSMSEDLDKASTTHARIYGINTLGACLGSLLAGYFLIPTFGLHWSVTSAAFLNLGVGCLAFGLYGRKEVNPLLTTADLRKNTPPLGSGFSFDKLDFPILAIGLLSGFYLLTLQTVLVRLVGLNTGSSNYNFTLVVTIFIFGLGLGSLLARKIDHYSSGRLFWNQIGLSFSLFLVYLSANSWGYWGHLLRILFRDMPEAFYPYQAALGLGFALILLVPIGFAGLTLPLCFHLIKDRKENLGNRVGLLYGLNTLGCVGGALIGGYFLLNYFDLDQLFKFCVFLSALTVFVAGSVYLRQHKVRPVPLGLATALTLFVVVGIWLAPLYSKFNYIQPFRKNSPIPDVSFHGAQAFRDYLGRGIKYVFYKDGPNTSVGILAGEYNGHERSRTIVNNGKSDGNTPSENFTTTMLAHIPTLLAENPERACVIGFGTGSTIGALSLYPEIKNIDVAEISGTLIENRQLFDAYNWEVSKNPKVHLHEMDAFRFLEGADAKFDVIISEPSNPWVVGIENLYTREFYKLAQRKLNDGGLFIQWIHTYSFNDDLLRMVLNTMTQEFPYVAAWQLKGGDMALLGSGRALDRSDLRRAARRFSSSAAVTRALVDVGIERFESVLALEMVPFSLSKVIAEGAQEQSLENPKLSNGAARAFFANTNSSMESLRRQYREFYPAVMDSLLADYNQGKLASQDVLASFRKTFCDEPMSRNGFLCEETLAALKVRNPLFRPEVGLDNSPSVRDLASLERFSTAPKGKFTTKDLDEAVAMFDSYRKYESPLAMIPADPFLSRVEYCINTTSKTEELHGHCLLQKILMLETVRMRNAEFKESVATYMNWFDDLPQTAPSYAKLKEARDILEKLVKMEKKAEEQQED